jgi:hypothetical protein
MLQPSMFAGVADQAAIIKLRQMGVNVRDGLATDRAIDEIWKAVDSGVVRPMIVRGRPREKPTLSEATGCQLTFRPHPQGGYALERWGSHIAHIVADASRQLRGTVLRAA